MSVFFFLISFSALLERGNIKANRFFLITFLLIIISSVLLHMPVISLCGFCRGMIYLFLCGKWPSRSVRFHQNQRLTLIFPVIGSGRLIPWAGKWTTPASLMKNSTPSYHLDGMTRSHGPVGTTNFAIIWRVLSDSIVFYSSLFPNSVCVNFWQQ